MSPASFPQYITYLQWVTKNTFVKFIISWKNRNINVIVTHHCLVSNLQKNEILEFGKGQFGRLSLLADSLWLFTGALGSFVGGLIICGSFWWFLIVACFNNYEACETSIILGKQIHVSDQSSRYQKVIRDWIQLHDTITSCK